MLDLFGSISSAMSGITRGNGKTDGIRCTSSEDKSTFVHFSVVVALGLNHRCDT